MNDTGYTILRNAFDPTALLSASSNVLEQNVTQSFIYEDDGSIRSVFAPHRLDSSVNDFVYDNPAIAEVKKLIGNDIYVHQVHFNYKLAGVGGEYAWHSDYTYWHHFDGMPTPDAVSVLFLLDDMTLDNGPLEILLGSHVDPVDPPPTTEWTIKHNAEELCNTVSKTAYKRHTATGAAGDIVLMHANLKHASKANKSHKNRKVLFVCYNAVKNATTATVRPEYITLKDFSPV
jgi:ectoine hydroxylase